MTSTSEASQLTLGFSSCPNDTFMFHGLVSGATPVPGVEWQVTIQDIEKLNQMAMSRAIDVTKISFHALGRVRENYALLASGAALGRGCGPLLVGRDESVRDRLDSARVAIPGWNTSATLLLRMFAPQLRSEQLVEVTFDHILEMTARGDVDAGLIIHESRFTFARHGLVSLVDLGNWWEEASGLPIPLGGIIVRRALPDTLQRSIETALRESVLAARRDPTQSRDYVRSHAQEMDEDVQQAHIDLYVNDYSVDLKDEGRHAIRAFLDVATERGVLPPYTGPLFVDDHVSQ